MRECSRLHATKKTLRPLVAALCALALFAAITALASQTTNRAVPDGYQEYRSDEYHFSLFYTEELTVSEYPDGDGANITFINASGTREFIVTVIPYSDLQFTTEGFGLYSPALDADRSPELRIAHVIFESSPVNPMRAWFTRDGLLYQVITTGGDADWLGQILHTWQFTD